MLRFFDPMLRFFDGKEYGIRVAKCDVKRALSGLRAVRQVRVYC